MNGYGNRGSLGLNLSIIASYSFARDWDDETRRALLGHNAHWGIDLVSRNERSTSSLALGGQAS